MFVKIFKAILSYWTLAIVCALLAFVSIPFLQGTNTGEDFCVYTVEGREGTYVRNGADYELYDAQKHADIEKTYIRRGINEYAEYFVNKPNWRFMNKACVLRKESILTFAVGYLISFLFLFAVFGSMRFMFGKIFTFLTANLLQTKI